MHTSLVLLQHSLIQLFYQYIRQTVLVAVQDEAQSKITNDAYTALKLLGATQPTLTYRASYALIGYKNSKRPFWIKENKKAARKGPTILNGTISFTLPPSSPRQPGT